MNNFDQFKKDFKRDLLIQIVVNMKHGKTTKNNAGPIVKSILEIFREEKEDNAFFQINRISQSHPEILDIFIRRAKEYDERLVNIKIPQIKLNLKGGEMN